jgi:hypothetical protein
MTGYLRFQHREIVEPGRWITVRIGFERELAVGDRIALIDEDDLAFAFATVRWTARMKADDVAYHDFDGYPTFFSTGEFLEHIRPYYPDVEVEPDTVVTVIALEDVIEPYEPRPIDGPGRYGEVITGP